MLPDRGVHQKHIYKSDYGQVTHKEPFTKGVERTHLQYIESKVIDDVYWIVASNKNGTYVTYKYDF